MNCKANIYDLAGNVFESTLEHAITSSIGPCAYRGGGLCDQGSEYPVSVRDGDYTNGSYYDSRF